MSSQTATTAIFIDSYHPKADGTCAVSIRITYDRKKKYYPTPKSLSVEDFEKTKSSKPREPYKSYALDLQSYEKKAADIIKVLPVFTWLAFEKKYLSNRSAKDTIYSAFTERAKILRAECRIGTAVSYECAQQSLNKFSPDTRFADVTKDFLCKYEAWMLSKKNSPTTVGIYLRALRAIVNNAIDEGLLSKDYYPFGKAKYEIPRGNNKKKALTIAEIGSIYNFKTIPGSSIDKAKDYWFFMYLCNGINMKDMALLKWENIEQNILSFERAKTIRTKRVIEPIRIPLVEDAKMILEKWANPNTKKEDYIFPILSKGQSPESERSAIQQAIKTVNKYMKGIAKDLEIVKKSTTYVARHSFATILQRSGASESFISEALGHSNMQTTQNYLAGFEDDAKIETVKALTAFKNS